MEQGEYGYKDMIEIGGKLEIVIKRIPRKIKGYSMVQDITSEGELVITQPMRDGIPVVIRLNDTLRVFFFQEESCFAFDGKPIERFKIENANMISIRQISPIEKVQRRQFYRLRIVLPVNLKLLDVKGDAPIIRAEY